jgi:hypothetical protein
MKKDMPWLRRAAKSALAILLLIDALAIYEFWRYGPPIAATAGTSANPPEMVFKVSRVPPSTGDWAILGGLVAAHLLVIWLLRRRAKEEH